MSSLHFPCSTSPSFHSHSSSPHFFAKPSHLITHARGNCSLHISCATAPSGDQNQKKITTTTSHGKLERRSMLLGLGGVASLTFTPWASASPLEAPDFNKCDSKDLNCCPPVSQNAIDYWKVYHFTRRVRKPAHKLSPEDIYKFNLAIYRMKQLPSDDPRSFVQQAKIHCAYCSGPHGINVHGSWLFFPFHRWYLYFFERILGKLIGDSEWGLPYWNWDHEEGMTVPPMFLDTSSALSHRERRVQGGALVNMAWTGNTNPQQVKENNIAQISREMKVSNVYDFMGQRFVSNTTNVHPGTSERGSHAAVHRWVGGDMTFFETAGQDPLFYSHHANVDRMWSLWRRQVSNEMITDPDFLNSAFLFYDENKTLVRVKVKDCLDPYRLGYGYWTTEMPWMGHKLPPVNRNPAQLRILRTKTYDADLRTDNVFPLKLIRVVKLLVPKARKGKANEELVIRQITVDTTKFVKFDVFVNDEDNDVSNLNKASYLGTFSQLPQGTAKSGTQTASASFKLDSLYDDLNVGDEDTSIVVTLVPRHEGEGVTIGGIKIFTV
ncbi:hypothetical protein Pfo_007057 [Paulownia fortunei]|nr:hypothetical protein Pfo_007057 [Paulownia fortunei]